MISAEDAKELAVSYSAYLEALKSEDATGIQIWGSILILAQEKTGVCLLDAMLIKTVIETRKC